MSEAWIEMQCTEGRRGGGESERKNVVYSFCGIQADTGCSINPRPHASTIAQDSFVVQ